MRRRRVILAPTEAKSRRLRGRTIPASYSTFEAIRPRVSIPAVTLNARQSFVTYSWLVCFTKQVINIEQRRACTLSRLLQPCNTHQQTVVREARLRSSRRSVRVIRINRLPIEHNYPLASYVYTYSWLSTYMCTIPRDLHIRRQLVARDLPGEQHFSEK